MPALLALARIKSIEQLRHVAPGERRNLLGLDRIPEVRTLRCASRRSGLWRPSRPGAVSAAPS